MKKCFLRTLLLGLIALLTVTGGVYAFNEENEVVFSIDDESTNVTNINNNELLSIDFCAYIDRDSITDDTVKFVDNSTGIPVQWKDSADLSYGMQKIVIDKCVLKSDTTYTLTVDGVTDTSMYKEKYPKTCVTFTTGDIAPLEYKPFHVILSDENGDYYYETDLYTEGYHQVESPDVSNFAGYFEDPNGDILANDGKKYKGKPEHDLSARDFLSDGKYDETYNGIIRQIEYTPVSNATHFRFIYKDRFDGLDYSSPSRTKINIRSTIAQSGKNWYDLFIYKDRSNTDSLVASPVYEIADIDGGTAMIVNTNINSFDIVEVEFFTKD